MTEIITLIIIIYSVVKFIKMILDDGLSDDYYISENPVSEDYLHQMIKNSAKT
ncbi:MAG: hypothetical protein IKJ47_02430 [Oscillospiraceae bacterium]|nr:hypothetical protein [Oscillospiraceae bacterium]